MSSTSNVLLSPEVIAGAVGALAASVPTFISVWFTLRHNTNSTKEKESTERTLAIVNEYHSAEFEKKRLSAYRLLADNKGQTITDVTKPDNDATSDLKSVIRYFSRVEALGKSKLIRLDLIKDLLGDPHIKIWHKTLVSDMKEESAEGHWSYAMKQIESLAKNVI
jgi:hypothetical protein